jgi:hypothetical protein
MKKARGLLVLYVSGPLEKWLAMIKIFRRVKAGV